MKADKHAEPENIVTIDGPAGAGKSTVARALARRLNFTYLDTGAMYRVVALEAKRRGINPEDDVALEALCRNLEISFGDHGPRQRVFSAGEDVTEAIRDPEIGSLASAVSARAPVREAMVRLQREIGSRGRVVAEGRDTGTVVFRGARYKFFLEASPGERARRRCVELRAKGLDVNMSETEKEVRERDARDSSRRLAPLRPAEDARIIDSTGMSADQVVEEILDVIDPGLKKRG